MADYIEREAFLKKWCESYCRPKQNCREDCSFYDVITQFPAADVRETVTGEWIKDGKYGQFYVCNNCGEQRIFPHWRYCPDCGADMRPRDNE